MYFTEYINTCNYYVNQYKWLSNRTKVYDRLYICMFLLVTLNIYD